MILHVNLYLVMETTGRSSLTPISKIAPIFTKVALAVQLFVKSCTIFRENLTNGLAPDTRSQQAAVVFPLGIMFYSLCNPWKVLQKL
jgi:hypothetical protein